MERDFLRTLSLVRSKDPSIYEKSTKFYSDEGIWYKQLHPPRVSLSLPSPPLKPVPSAEQKKKPQPPMFLKDHERKRLLERGR